MPKPMETPIYDFVTAYATSGTARLHMPGHKGVPQLGCEPFDITEVAGADALYEAEGIIRQSEENAARLFGTQRTLFSTEGSSQCIRAMLFLAASRKKGAGRTRILAGRNAHKAFLYAAALLDLDVTWLWPQNPESLLSCPITPADAEEALAAMAEPPAALYVTCPDYLGGGLDLPGLAALCHRHDMLLLVDNAHGAYLKFLPESRHPIDLGADMCCDSAHKTLPVLTGGAYLHLSHTIPPSLAARSKEAMALFGSTSPSYLTLCSLDLCNRTLAKGYPASLEACVNRLEGVKHTLRERGWTLFPSDPLKLTLLAPAGQSGFSLAEGLRHHGIEPEYADPDALVLMVTPQTDPEVLHRLPDLLGPGGSPAGRHFPPWRGRQRLSIREAMFAPRETLAVRDALGRICAAPTVGCPPTIPIAVSGEEITREMQTLFAFYGISTLSVVM